MELKNIAFSRIAEPLSKGQNIKKLLELHIAPYTDQIEKSEQLENLKNLSMASREFLEWFGILKGVPRAKKTIVNNNLEAFLNVFTPDPLGFSDTDLSKPLYFGQTEYFELSDIEYRLIISAYCNATGFRGTVDEYSQFFRDVFGVDAFIRLIDGDLEFIVENTLENDINYELGTQLVPVLFQTKNSFFQSPSSLFSLEFTNIKGSSLSFDNNKGATFYFPF